MCRPRPSCVWTAQVGLKQAKGRAALGGGWGRCVYVRGSQTLCLPAPHTLVYPLLRGTLHGQGLVRTKVCWLCHSSYHVPASHMPVGLQNWKRVMALALEKQDASGQETLPTAPSCVAWAGSAVAAQGRGPLELRLGTDLVYSS